MCAAAPAQAPANAQLAPLSLNSAASAWIEAAAARQVGVIEQEANLPVRYRMHRIDSKTDLTREIIDSREGSLARTVEINGQPLTPVQDDAERNRLNAILRSPDDFLRKQKRAQSARAYAISLVKLMPSAMIYSYTPGQPQPPGCTRPQVVLDFKPDPNFRPPSMVAELLTGLAGRLWIDKRTMTLTRGEGHILRGVNFGWGGVLAHIYPGGTIEFEQTEAEPGRWVYSHVAEKLTVREMLFKTAQEKTQMWASDFHILPAPVTYDEAIRELLTIQVARREETPQCLTAAMSACGR